MMKRIAFVVLVMLIVAGSVFAGIVICSACNDGKVTCYYCDGARKVQAGSFNGNPVMITCSICYGTGKTDCRVCKGRGYWEE